MVVGWFSSVLPPNVSEVSYMREPQASVAGGQNVRLPQVNWSVGFAVAAIE
jgi:hypothetical protein